MKKETKKPYKGVRGRRLKIEPEKVDSILSIEENALIQKGKVIGAGPDTFCKVGDTVIFNAWGCDSVTIGEDKFYYILDTDEFILEIV